MKPGKFKLNRRKFLKLLGVAGFTIASSRTLHAIPQSPITRTIPSSSKTIPVIGMGTWLTFSIGDDSASRAVRVEILREFFNRGGVVIDSSPMYGSSQEVIGYCLQRLSNTGNLFAATKVWTPGRWLGIRQMVASLRLWGTVRFDLMQVHNLLDSKNHLPTLQEWKEQGRIRYLGVTTSHGRRHAKLEKIMREQPLDFVQFTYNILDREAEQRLLPLAQDRGIAVIINRPFQGGNLFGLVQGKPLPDWTNEFDCKNWAQFFLKFIVAHPAVTCTIPATSKVAHMQENMGALYGRLPDEPMRRKMLQSCKASEANQV